MILTCYECGKVFERDYLDEYVYKKAQYDLGGHNKKTLYFCGWNCMRNFERKREKKQWKKG